MQADTRLIVVHPDALALLGMQALLAPHPDLEIVAQSRQIAEIPALCSHYAPHVLLVALTNVSDQLLEGLAQQKQRDRALQILVLSLDPQPYPLLQRLQTLVIAGYLTIDDPLDSIVHAIRAVRLGGGWFSPALANRLSQWSASDLHQTYQRHAPERLTNRECEVLALLATGLSNREIGRTLGIAERTVRHHSQNLCEKLALATRREVVAWAARIGR